LVTDVKPDSPAEKAGLQEGDIVTKFDGKGVKDLRHLRFTVAMMAPGQKASMDVLRNGKTQSIDLNIGSQPKDRGVARGERGRQSPEAQDDDNGTLNGVGVADLDAQARREFDVPAAVRGALVTSVDPDSAAATAGLQPGDVIQEINRQRVKNAEEAVKLTEKTETKKTLLRVWSQRGSRFVVVDETAAP
jgi:serine protease Do